MQPGKRCKLHKGIFRKAETRAGPDGKSLDLILPDIPEKELRDSLPCVSVITITKDRGMFAALMLYNWMAIQYPREKLEWVILDDSQDRGSPYQLSDYIPPDDPYIKYHKLPEWSPVSAKRNMAVQLAKYDHIVHMDDDDYYFPEHVLVKMRIMQHYNCSGVHSMPIGVYDMMERSSYIFSSGTKNSYNTNDVAEATMAYTKSYWEKNKFCSDRIQGTGEGRAFVGKNFKQWVTVDFFFNMVSITHSLNVTGNNRRFINENQERIRTGNFEDVFPADFNALLTNIRKILVQK